MLQFFTFLALLLCYVFIFYYLTSATGELRTLYGDAALFCIFCEDVVLVQY